MAMVSSSHTDGDRRDSSHFVMIGIASWPRCISWASAHPLIHFPQSLGMRGNEIRIRMRTTAILERPSCGRTNIHLHGSIFATAARVEAQKWIGLKTAALRPVHTG